MIFSATKCIVSCTLAGKHTPLEQGSIITYVHCILRPRIKTIPDIF